MGTQLQPALYLLAAAKDKRPVGAYYFGAGTDYSREGSGDFRMSGVMDCGEDVVKNSDALVAFGEKSTFIDAVYGGKPTTKNLARDDFADLLQYAKLVTAQGISEFCGGNITPSPTEKACQYCSMGGCCDFNATETEPRKKSAKIDELIKVVRGEVDDNET